MLKLSNVIAVKQAIYELIRGIPEASIGEWSIFWDTTREPTTTCVYVGAVQWSNTEWVKQKTRQEEFAVSVDCSVQRRRLSLMDTEIEVCRIGSLISDKISQVPNLGLPEVVTCVVSPRSVESQPADEFNWALMGLSVRVTARLTSPGVM